MSRFFRHGTGPVGQSMLQMHGKPARYVMAEGDGEGDLVGLGEEGPMVEAGKWLPISKLPKWAREASQAPGKEPHG